MSTPDPVWRALTAADLSSLVALARRVVAADGGVPVTESFLRRRYLDGVLTAAAVLSPDSAELRAAVAVRPGPDGAVTAAVLVDPGWAIPGLDAALGWIFNHTATAVRVETESLTEGADEVLRRRGLHQTFAEDVLRLDLRTGSPGPAELSGVDLLPWTAGLAPRFFAVYEAAFADRPGFPGWSCAQWTDWIAGDDDFAPQWSLLASRAGVDVGYVACAQEPAFVVQVGVVPAARGAGLGGGLTAAALDRMRAAGCPEVTLDVNVNNPGAASVYHRLGFGRIGRRARYER